MNEHRDDAQTIGLERTVRDHGPWLLRWFGRRTPRDDAEDMTQETLLSLVRNRGRIREPDRIASYLLTAARRILRDHIDRQRDSDLSPPEELAAPALPVDDRVIELHRALRELPPELEQAIDVYYTRELTYDECANTLGIPRSLLQSRLRRAKEILRRRMGEVLEAPTH